MEQSKSIPVVKKEKQKYTGGEKRSIPVVKKEKQNTILSHSV